MSAVGRGTQVLFGVNDMNEERCEVGCAYLEIPVIFLDGGKGFLPDVPYIRASKEPDSIHCSNKVASVSRIDDAYRVGQTHPRLTDA
jgi:hypothetical protein